MDVADRHEWLRYSELAWNASGRPESLNPALVESDPVRYDEAYYRYFERRYFDLWLNLYQKIRPEDGRLFRAEDPEFREAWRRNFSWHSTWKQTLPLFVYGATLGVDNHVLVEIAAHYCIGQAIPSIVVDYQLDDPRRPTMAADAAFCMLAYIKGLSGLRALQLPSSSQIEDIFLSHTRAMYGAMLSENAHRFILPASALSEAISRYFGPDSRLLSSIFFGVLPRWAFVLSGREPSAAVAESLDSLRKLRQLNDELADVDEDLARGLVTLPWLYALEEAPQIRQLMESYWRQLQNVEAREACHRALRGTRAMRRAFDMAQGLLSTSMNATMRTFAFHEAFELTLLQNVRWSYLNRIAANGFEAPAPVTQPSHPHRDLSSALNPVVPIAGAGTLVMLEDGRVLMSLILKRGMLRWELPAGVATDGEQMERTAERETLEETGYRVEVSERVALCWHFSRQLGKGWMGIFFAARLAGTQTPHELRVITAAGLNRNKVSFRTDPGLYHEVAAEAFDFEAFRQLCESLSARPTAHENVIASGFVSWTQIPRGRIHPLHHELLEAQRLGRRCELLVRDADTDVKDYEPGQPLYFRAGSQG